MAVTWNVAAWFSSVEKAAPVVNAGAVLVTTWPGDPEHGGEAVEGAGGG